MAAIRNLTQSEAVDRAAVLEVRHYDITLDLTGDGATFASRTVVDFAYRGTSGVTFIEVAPVVLRSATLNGEPLDLAGWSADAGLTLSELREENQLVIEGDFPYSTSGEGLHRLTDPADGEVYLYSQLCMAHAQAVFACFDQPDLKAEHTFRVTVPAHWQVASTMPASHSEEKQGSRTVHFARSPRMSTYLGAVCAGPYHVVRDRHGDVDLGVYCRASMAPHLDADDILTVTKQGLDFYASQFGIAYPLPKYDQLFLPEYNMGAMENFGCVTFAEDRFLFRAKATDAQYEDRAAVILHEMAHMWFGDLVTLRWWDDLWLNEAFAEWACYWAAEGSTRYTEAWATFLATTKNWGYRQDQLSSTHPVYTEVTDVESSVLNFDGITYAKGASVLKQLVASVGEEAFLAGLRSYFAAHAWSNATFADLLGALEKACGRDLSGFAERWLRTAQVNTLRPEVTVDADGLLTEVAVLQEAPASHPALRDHRIHIGLYDLQDQVLVRRKLVAADVTGARTVLPELLGERRPDVLLLNDDDLTFAKLRLDEHSAQTVMRHVAAFPGALQRALVWSAAWDMVSDAELPARAYLAQVAAGLAGERNVNIVEGTLTTAKRALTEFADPAWAATGWGLLHATAGTAIADAEPGSDRQLQWARLFAVSARTSPELAAIKGWLDGQDVPAGLDIDVDLRWLVVKSLAANGAASPADIDAALAGDDTAGGRREAATAHAALPDAAVKAEVWRRLTEEPDLPNWLQEALVDGFQQPGHADLLTPYAASYFAVVASVWDRLEGEPQRTFAIHAYPRLVITEETLAASEAWLAEEGHPGPLRRIVAEGRDRVARALKARARDAA